ncbi:ABC transporter ATP-binding protein [Candidatus Protochlamydia phocaeensis]|uniref:ABC transporter ATP-binding protein n=1 Tax=Candidatus Protochlamydia phocaeensis TaxID=1414722 RepID=UPI0008387EB1|nr:ATP-binding cassette domain-containing protein [Candidatus Protochlamydia phocaeensis]
MIHVHDVWKSYGKLEVLKGLNLDVLDGETLVILGKSGVGKSVLLKQIIGLETPDRGYVEVEGQRITDSNLRRGRVNIKPMGMLFQGAALFDSMNVGENTAFYLRQHLSLAESEITDRVAYALKMVGLEGTQNKMPSELSGGMRKRAALARLIVYRPQIILYDEPTTGLDPVTAMQINDLINQTKYELKATSIVVTHDIRSALEVGDRLAFHSDGKITQIAPKSEFLKIDDPLLHDFFSNAIINNEYVEQHRTPGGS